MDIIYVTYNSEKWVENCFASIVKSEYDLKTINIYVVDNASQDDTVKKLYSIKNKWKDVLGSFEIIESKENLGFGRGNNLGFSKGTSDIVCFFNIDTEVYPDTLSNLDKDILSSPENIGLWELRQFPYEHPKLYDALTHETVWSSGAAFAMKRSVYEEMGGFDESIFMYAEDVDLSWRLRTNGYKLRYVPQAVINHYCYLEAGEVKPVQHVNSIINNIFLRYRFGGPRAIAAGHKLFWRCMLAKPAFEGSKKMLLKKYFEHFVMMPHFKNIRKQAKKNGFYPQFLGFDYAGVREGAFHVNRFPTERPLVSIIVRTCGRPCVLRETLQSLRSQTYSNIEIVVVEDGEDTARDMIVNEFKDLNIVYKATGKREGRSKAGNLAMSLAKGKYLNFLDDDDLFFADHVEVLVNALNESECRAAYAFAFETKIDVKGTDPYIYTLGDYETIHKQSFDRVMLCHHNYIPIQCIMFEKSLFEEYGGLDESLDALEDWDLWVRYSCYTDFECVEKTTSVYRVPMNQKISGNRQRALDDALLIVRKKHRNYPQRALSAYDMSKLYEVMGR